MRLQPHFAAAVAAFVATAWVVHMRSDVRKSGEDVEGMQDWQYEGVSIDGGVGPESFAFDPRGEGPYTGISDGRIIKWQRSENRWLNFSLSTPTAAYQSFIIGSMAVEDSCAGFGGNIWFVGKTVLLLPVQDTVGPI
ncbi:Protein STRICTOSIDINE SYNTHASE-LIKE 2 [Vigna angularis]|uniref:Protein STRICTOSIDINE SYNTHASE-LIKE 2 n=1 Tax=Phaseolus angularis TaxID=3914 RepID=A0A8T0L3L6_PHAAN|nr:Protein STRICTOSIDINE SYNTHASE-LIKE 2 [Vigna angularis]